MDVLLWLGWVFAIVVTVFTVWMLAAGVVCAKSPDWSRLLHDAGVTELVARGYCCPARTSDEEEIINGILGAGPDPADPTFDARVISAIRALTDASDSDLARLHRVRTELLQKTVSRQHAAVEQIASPRHFVRVWNLRRARASLQAAATGLRWFVPLFATRTRRMGERYLATATLIGIWSGLLFWGFAQMSGSGHAEDWLTIVGFVITFAGAVGLVASVGRQIYAVATAWWGPPARWSVKGIVSGVVMTLAFGLVLVLLWTGRMTDAWVAATAWLARTAEHYGSADSAGSVVLILLLLFLCTRTIKRVMTSRLIWTERISSAFVTLFLAGMAAVVLVRLIRAPHPWMTLSITATAGTLTAFAAYEAMVGAVRWRQDVRFLSRADVDVPRRGFRRWALLSWLAGLLLVTIVPALLRAVDPGWWTSSLGQVTSLVLSVVSLGLALTFLPGAIVTGLYVRRVSRIATSTRHRRQPVPLTSEEGSTIADDGDDERAGTRRAAPPGFTGHRGSPRSG